MSRPKGSKNKSTLVEMFNEEQAKPYSEKNFDSDIQKQSNTYDEYINEFVDGFITKMYNDGILKTIDKTLLQTWFANPDQYIEKINNLLNYYYIVNGDIFQLYDLVRVLPSLNYKIDVYDNTKKYEKNLTLCNKTLNKVKHKQLTRDVLSQLVSEGTLIGTWLGDKKNPYFYIFDNLKYVFPAYRLNGQWVAQLDLAWFDDMKDKERQIYYKNLSSILSENDYLTYRKNMNDDSKRYIELPLDKTVVLRTHTTSRNQRLGLPWGTQAIFDMQHKQKLKDLETSVSNKIINAIAVLKLNSVDGNGTKIMPPQKKKVYARVKQALEQNSKNGITVISIPDFADFEFPEFKAGDMVLDPKKYESVSGDITNSTGISTVLTNGSGGNFASAKMNLTTIYRKIGELLEDIETEIYGRLFEIVLPSSVSDEYLMVYDKEEPLTLKEKIEILKGLHSEGFAVKPIIDGLQGIDYDSYIQQSIYEIEVLKLREKIIPPMLSYTTSGADNNGGAPTVDEPTNSNTIISKTSDGNNAPKAGV